MANMLIDYQFAEFAKPPPFEKKNTNKLNISVSLGLQIWVSMFYYDICLF